MLHGDCQCQYQRAEGIAGIVINLRTPKKKTSSKGKRALDDAGLEDSGLCGIAVVSDVKGQKESLVSPFTYELQRKRKKKLQRKNSA